MKQGPPAVRRAALALLLLAATLCLPTSPGAEADGARVGGYVKGFATALDPAAGGEGMEGTVLTRTRLVLDWRRGKAFSFHGAYELSPVARTRVGPSSRAASPFPFGEPYRVADIRRRLYPPSGEPEGKISLIQTLDRAVATISWSAADLSVGRQAIAFGSARAVNPTDVIAPFAYEELDKEERVGVDAVRLRVPVGAMGEIDCGVVFGRDAEPEESAAFARVKGYLGDTDVTGIAMVYRENVLLGVDLARAIGGAGSWLEAAYSLPDLLRDGFDREGVLRLSFGIDAYFERGIYAFGEYHYNGAGSRRPSEYLDPANAWAYEHGAVYLLGRHYLVPGLSCDITPLLGLRLEALINLTDPSALASGRLAYSMAQDLSAEVGGFLRTGRGPRNRADMMTGVIGAEPRSEFGLYPNLLFATVRFYF